MRSNSLGRRSSTNPVRISMFEREDRSVTRIDSRKTQTLKSKHSVSTADSSHIPRSRLPISANDRASRGATLKATGRTPLRHGSTTPRTPSTNASKHSALLTVGSSNRIHTALPTGPRSLSADRASSLSTKGSRKDTRPLTDKMFQAHMLTTIDNYFSMNQLSFMLNSNGSLKPVTLKMFVEVSAHLVKMLDIKQVLTVSNYVEELPKIAKKLHYPGVITKSWLKTANATLSWPNVLGWICWLVEICKVREIALQKYNLNNLPFVGDDTASKSNKNAFFSMLDFYNAWNEEKLEEEAAMVEKYLQEIEAEQGVNEEDLNNVLFEIEEETAKLQAAEENGNKTDEEVKHLQEVLLSLQNKETMQLSDLTAKEEYIKTINLETDKINTECNVLCEQIHLQNVQQNEILSVIKEQPMSTTERDKIVGKCTEIENYIIQFDEHLQEIRKELYNMDMKLSSVHNNLNKKILAYNKEIIMHLNGDMGVNVEELKMPDTCLLDPQIMEVLNAKADLMNELKDTIKKQLIEKERSVELKSNELEHFQERMKVLEDESSDVANKIQEKKRVINKIKTDVKNEEAKLKEQIRILQNDIIEIQDQMPDKQKLATELEEAEDKLAAVHRRRTYIKESAKVFFDQFYEILGEHRNELYNTLMKHSK
ncbi:kinetochore protein Ndc80 [Calliopsis andreniformis]|uniref:kinetochore protein Ndc80 n=1 Tax=Calliopsis andreniformis TaxID=337506 RepID=UPI003FCD95ED